MARGSVNVPLMSMTSPRRTNSSANLASSPMTTRSQARARLAPPPAAYPRTAAIPGLGQYMIRASTPWMRSIRRRISSGEWGSSSRAERSTPEQKWPPAPVRTNERIDASAAM